MHAQGNPNDDHDETVGPAGGPGSPADGDTLVEILDQLAAEGHEDEVILNVGHGEGPTGTWSGCEHQALMRDAHRAGHLPPRGRVGPRRHEPRRRARPARSAAPPAPWSSATGPAPTSSTPTASWRWARPEPERTHAGGLPCASPSSLHRTWRSRRSATAAPRPCSTGSAAVCVDAGHDVLLVTTGDATCPVERTWCFEEATGVGIRGTIHELTPRGARLRGRRPVGRRRGPRPHPGRAALRGQRRPPRRRDHQPRPVHRCRPRRAVPQPGGPGPGDRHQPPPGIDGAGGHRGGGGHPPRPAAGAVPLRRRRRRLRPVPRADAPVEGRGPGGPHRRAGRGAAAGGGEDARAGGGGLLRAPRRAPPRPRRPLHRRGRRRRRSSSSSARPSVLLNPIRLARALRHGDDRVPRRRHPGGRPAGRVGARDRPGRHHRLRARQRPGPGRGRAPGGGARPADLPRGGPHAASASSGWSTSTCSSTRRVREGRGSELVAG